MHVRICSIFWAMTLWNCSNAIAQDLVFKGKPSEYENYGYMVRGAAWTFKEGQPKAIFVCWENDNRENEDERGWIKEQILATWGQQVPIAFKGWATCAQRNSGIRIYFNDEGPHVKMFGRNLDGLKNGMVLNNTFQNWAPECRATKEHCIRSIATHEFGHALGFAHEQNRPDAPGECGKRHGQGQAGEILLTPYDPLSVMNYCNSSWNNGGRLSDLDIKAAQATYGTPN